MALMHHSVFTYEINSYTNCADIFMLDLYPIYKNTSVSDEDIRTVY